MYKGKYSAKKKPFRFGIAAWVCSFLLLATAAIGGTAAYLMDSSSQVTNTFTLANVSCAIEEDFSQDRTVKNDVKIKNTGSTAAYIRAAVVVTWQDENGNVYPVNPVEGKDYNIKYQNADSWKNVNGFWYYTTPVSVSGETKVLFTNCYPEDGKAPTGYHLDVTILAQAIQSEPAKAVEGAWGVTVGTDGTITN